MFTAYIKERKAWIFFFLSLQIWLNIILTLDVAFLEISIVYINFVNTLSFLLFLVWRYRKETVYYKALEESLENKNKMGISLASLPKGESVLEKKITSTMEELIFVGNDELNRMKVKHLEEKDQILSWIHEVKTPLTGMKLIIDALEERSIRSKLEIEWLRIHLLLDQQLHHTRLPSIEKDYMIELVNIQKLVYIEIKELQVWCMEKGIGFEIELIPEEILTDQKWLSFIVRQMLSNAVKYSEENREVHVFSKKDETDHIVLSIQDYGIGITQADLPRIFDKSFTGTTGRNTAASTGMGLYLAKKAADKLGIRIVVDSEVGIGSTFSLQFPLKNEMTRILGR